MWIRSTNSRPKSRSLGVKFVWPRLKCRRWATSPSARTPKITYSPFGNGFAPNRCPGKAGPFVVITNGNETQNEKGKYEYRHNEIRIPAPFPRHPLGQKPLP